LALANVRILSIRRAATVETFPCPWLEQPEPLRACDIVFGCVDAFAERRELEIACRRHLVPLIDISTDVHNAGAITPHLRLVYHDGAPWPHFPPDKVGAPVFKKG